VQRNQQNIINLEALPVHNRRPRLIVLLLADPHLLERGQGRQDRPSDPHRVLPLRRRYYLDLHRGGRQGGYLLLHAISDTREHGGTSGQHRVGV